MSKSCVYGTRTGENQCGYAVEPDNAELFADALADAADHPEKIENMAVRAQGLGRKEFNREKLADDFVAWLERTVKR